MSEAPIIERTHAEMAARQQQQLAPAPAEEIPPLLHPALDPERVTALWEEAQRWRPEQPTLALLQLLFEAAGYPLPPGRTPLEVISNLRRMGWIQISTCLATPIPGALYVVNGPDGEPSLVGIVAKQHTGKGDGSVLRDYFTEAAGLGRLWGLGSHPRGHVQFMEVDLFLFPPGSCQPCIWRQV
jgi:hypothetical protein